MIFNSRHDPCHAPSNQTSLGSVTRLYYELVHCTGAQYAGRLPSDLNEIMAVTQPHWNKSLNNRVRQLFQCGYTTFNPYQWCLAARCDYNVGTLMSDSTIVSI